MKSSTKAFQDQKRNKHPAFLCLRKYYPSIIGYWTSWKRGLFYWHFKRYILLSKVLSLFQWYQADKMMGYHPMKLKIGWKRRNTWMMNIRHKKQMHIYDTIAQWKYNLFLSYFNNFWGSVFCVEMVCCFRQKIVLDQYLWQLANVLIEFKAKIESLKSCNLF